ncbi:kinase domain protein (macronuclear) [Tetrahymena thermophila SB210]|uniref:Kinase domain protein n=1 Tax=Tetrahymena thermophila (strain SB210) TaxID=312017 RepID=W7X578_TETTS|nr:kinase domain protein [Tetrahymena thermophila SB210]EWS74520.1 kinase domain protein [Tetrahymena thermophila SB210]|eukprot:XP_012652950.1 kinase domain protein [Tetrahymena thermophila SB210]
MQEYLQKKLQEYSSKPNQQDQSYYTTYNNFGFILYNRQDYHQAIENLRKSIEIQTIIYQKNLHLDLAITQLNIAFCYTKLKEYQIAIEYCSKSYSDFQKIIQNDNPYSFHFENLIGTCYYNLEDYSKAKQKLKISQEIAEQFDLKNLQILSLKIQSEFYIKKNDPFKVIQIYFDILPLQEKQLGKYHTEIADLKQNIADNYFQLTLYDKAIIQADQSYQIYLLNKNKVKQQQQEYFIIKCLSQILC